MQQSFKIKKNYLLSAIMFATLT